MAAKVHLLYKWISNPSIVTLCGALDCDHLLVARDVKNVTCVRCLKISNKHATRHNIIQLPESCPLCDKKKVEESNA